MQDLTVTLVQGDTRWHSVADNLDAYGEMVAAAPPSDLIVLPETFTTGFTMDAAAQAESMAGSAMQWLAALAAQRQCTVTGSLVIEDDRNHYNRLIWMRADGSYEYYDKRHLFRMAGEHNHYTAGERRVAVELNGWQVCPQVCYDLRFPVWTRQSAEQPFDLQLFVANWPEPRRNAWNTLLEARAIENLAYVIGVNRVGRDGNGRSYAGDSKVVDFKGKVIVDGGDAPGCYTATLAVDALRSFREKFPAHLDADQFTVGAAGSTRI